MTENTKGCGIARRPCARCWLKSAEVLQQPSIAQVSQEGSFRFRVRMPREGADKITIRWCEFKLGNPNECYNILYSIKR